MTMYAEVRPRAGAGQRRSSFKKEKNAVSGLIDNSTIHSKPVLSVDDDISDCAGVDDFTVKKTNVVEGSIDWIPLICVSSIHIGALVGAYFQTINWIGFKAMIIMYIMTGMGVTVGYHRLFSHRSYNAHPVWKLFWGFWGSGALQGSILWWSRLHRLHHSFPDTPADPYGANHGFWWSHCKWMFVKKDLSQYIQRINVNDLKRDKIVMLQNRHFVPIAMFVAYGMPLLMCQSDLLQGFIYGGLWARILCWHSTWFVNSLAHWLGHNNFSIETSAKDHYLTALLTFGEGNHGFHHSFAFSYQNGLFWYQFDPTRTVIEIGEKVGLTYNLQHPSQNELKKAMYQVQEHKLLGVKQSIVWPDANKVHNKIMMKEYKNAKGQGKYWISMNGKVYDITKFASQHPGGATLIKSMASKDPDYVTRSFSFKHTHSNAARNMLDMLIVGILEKDSGEECAAVDTVLI